MQAAGLHIDVTGDTVILLKDCLAFADGNFEFIVAEIDEVAEPPDT